MVDKSVKGKKDKKPEETVTIEEEDLFEDFPASKGDDVELHLCQHDLALCLFGSMVLHCSQPWPRISTALHAH